VAWDPSFSSVSMLLHFDGADTSTTFTDSSSSPRTVTPVGNAQIKTAQSKFGGASGGFDGTGDYLTLDGSSGFAFGSGDFTIEFWVYVTTLSVAQTLYSSNANGEVNGAYPSILLDNFEPAIKYSLNGAYVIQTTSTLAINTWYHVAAARAGSSTKLFLNGVQEGVTFTDSTSLLIGAGAPQIGRLPFNNTQFLNGYLDDMRVTKGVARYTANFTPPAEAFADTAAPNIVGNITVSVTPGANMLRHTKFTRILSRAGKLVRSSNLPFHHIGI